MLTLNRPLLLALAAIAMALTLSVSPAAKAAPMCSGATSITDLGTEGCTFGDLTFSDFSFSGGAGFVLDPTPINPDDVLVQILDASFFVNIIESVPGIGVLVTPRDPAQWTAGGMFSSVSIALNYVVSSVNSTIDRYQLRGTGPGLSLRGPQYALSMTVDAGDTVASWGSQPSLNSSGNITPGTSQIAVAVSGSASPGLGGFGTTNIGSVTNIFTTVATPAPVAAPASLALALPGLLLLSLRRRQSTSTETV